MPKKLVNFRLNEDARVALAELSAAWGCSGAAVVERLLLEARDRGGAAAVPGKPSGKPLGGGEAVVAIEDLRIEATGGPLPPAGSKPSGFTKVRRRIEEPSWKRKK